MLYLKQKKFNYNGEVLVKRKSSYKLRLRFVVAAQEAKAVAPLSSTLGQFGLNCPDFCKKFNEETVQYCAGLLLTVYLDVLFDRTFKFWVKSIDYSEFFTTISNKDGFLSIVDLLRLNKVFMDWFNLKFWSSLETLIGTLRGIHSISLVLDTRSGSDSSIFYNGSKKRNNS